MKNIVPLALAAILSASSLVACTSSGTTNSISPGTATNDRVTVIFIKENIYDDADTQAISSVYRRPSPQTIAAAQNEIASNAGLRALLQGKSVQLRNVVGVQTALNGGKIVYVR